MALLRDREESRPAPRPGVLPLAGGPLPPHRLPSCCPSCGIVLEPEKLAGQGFVCGCGNHFPLHADGWISLLADEGSWREWWADLTPRAVPEWRLPSSYEATVGQATARGLNEAVRAGTCTIGGHPVRLAVFDFRFIGGTMGVVAGERLTRTAERAVSEGVPMLVVTASGGARMQEGVHALMQLAKINAALANLHDAGVPYISILAHPTYGGTAASLALLADVNIAEPSAAIGFTGPRVIRQATYETLPDDFQTAEFQLRHGQVDMIVPRYELRQTLDLLFSFFD